MIHTFTVLPGITLRCIPDKRFKQGRFSLQLVRPMCREEAGLNALLPAVLLRGSRSCPDLCAITRRLDTYYGASVGAVCRRVGDYQTTGLSCGLLEDRFAMAGDRILEPMMDFLRELLLEPALEDGVFLSDFVEGEKRNLLSAIETQGNDKRYYAMEQLLRKMCCRDSFGIPRLGEPEQIQAITPQSLYAHYGKILAESPVEMIYAGAAQPETVARLAEDFFRQLPRNPVPRLPQSPFLAGPETDTFETQEISQGKLCMGFTTGVTIRDPDFAAMQLCNLIFGGGQTSKLFMQVREASSLCYAIDSAYHGGKGLITVAAGIDTGKEAQVREQIHAQLEACQKGQITDQELTAAKESLRSGLLSTQDSPGALEGYYSNSVLSGFGKSPAEYIRAAEAVTVEQVAEMAQKVRLHSVFFLKGVGK